MIATETCTDRVLSLSFVSHPKVFLKSLEKCESSCCMSDLFLCLQTTLKGIPNYLLNDKVGVCVCLGEVLAASLKAQRILILHDMGSLGDKYCQNK